MKIDHKHINGNKAHLDIPPELIHTTNRMVAMYTGHKLTQAEREDFKRALNQYVIMPLLRQTQSPPKTTQIALKTGASRSFKIQVALLFGVALMIAGFLAPILLPKLTAGVAIVRLTLLITGGMVTAVSSISQFWTARNLKKAAEK